MNEATQSLPASIWFVSPPLDEINQRSAGTMIAHLGMEFTEIGSDSITARMPVDERTRQPAGILHGGASVALAETLGSIAGNLVVNPQTHYCVGLEINANHIRSCTDGFVEGVARPLHLGKSTQLWEMRISQAGKLVCVSRLTLAVLERKSR